MRHKTVILPARLNVLHTDEGNPMAEELVIRACNAGATRIVVGQWEQKMPFFPNNDDGSIHEKEAALRTRARGILNYCHSRGVEVYFSAQNHSKYAYGSPSAIPTKVCGQYPFSVSLSGNRFSLYPGEMKMLRVTLPAGAEQRLYDLLFNVVGGSVMIQWRWPGTNAKAALYPSVQPGGGLERVTLHSLSSLEWDLLVQANDQPVTVGLATIRERNPLADEVRGAAENGWYNFTGQYWEEPPRSDSFLGAISPRFERTEERIASYQIADKLLQAFPDLDGFNAHSDELTAQGWEESFCKRYVNVGQAYAQDVVAFACHCHKLLNKPVMVDADMFMPFHNAQVYSRANNPRNGGCWNSLAYISKDAPIDWRMWGELRPPIAQDIATFAGRTIHGGYDLDQDNDPAFWNQFPEIDALTLYGWDISRFTEERMKSYFDQC